ncbi:MAG: hypothetical protein ACE5KZ_09430 [Candidatus Scalinduaceae bacterium]
MGTTVIIIATQDITIVIMAIAIKSIMTTEATTIISITADTIGIKNTTVDITDMVITTIPGTYIDHTPIDIIGAMDASNYHTV